MRRVIMVGWALALALSHLGCDSRLSSSDGGGSDRDGGVALDAELADGQVIDLPDSSVDAPPVSDSPLVDPSCIDGMYSEVLPDPTVDISDLTAAYSEPGLEDFVHGVLQRRYPVGDLLVVGGSEFRECIRAFISDTSSSEAVIRRIGTVVHECGHFYDFALRGGRGNAYFITDALRFECANGDATERGGLTFARSRIRDDEYQGLRPGDFYADVYLSGDPDNGTFEGGDQGFNLLFEEVVQYVNSLATAYAFSEESRGRGSTSAKDGILTFLWYTTRYLRMARLEYPSAYEHILNGDSGCWRRLVLNVWGRSWLYLEATEDLDHLGIDETELMELVTAPELLEEIQRLREAEGCSGD